MTAEAQATYTYTTMNRSDFVALVYNRYGKKLYGYAISRWNLGEDESWELVYKALYKVSESHKQLTFESEEKFAAYLFRIFLNYLRNHYRDARRAAEKMDAVVITGTNSKDDSSNTQLNALKAELDKMDDWQRVLLLMRSGGAPYSEIAIYVNKPEDQLKVYYQRLKEQISKKLNGKS